MSMTKKEKILNSKPKTVELEFFGEKVEVRQQSMKSILEIRADSKGDNARAMALMIVSMVWDTETNQRLFEDTDADGIMDLPFGKDLSGLQQAISELTDIDIKAAGKNLEPTESPKLS